MKQNKIEQQLAFNLEKNTQKIEKDYQAKRRRRQKEKSDQDELSQQWLAPLLLLITLLVGYLLYTFY